MLPLMTGKSQTALQWTWCGFQGGRKKAAEETTDVVVNDTLTQAISNVENVDKIKWKGSGLGSEWDDLKGSGIAASSIVGLLFWCGWKITSKEVKVWRCLSYKYCHLNASYKNKL